MVLQGSSFLFCCALFLIAVEPSYQHFTNPFSTSPSPRYEAFKVRFRRDANDEPLWLYKGDDVERAPASADHPYLPLYIDDIKLDTNTRYARSVDSPSAKRGGGSHSTSSSSRNTGSTHPGYNRRNARSVHTPTIFNPPSPTFPRPLDPIFPKADYPGPKPIYPVFVRHARDVQLSPPLQKPTHYDITLPGWNPNARVQPWQKIRVRTGRDIHDNIDTEVDQ